MRAACRGATRSDPERSGKPDEIEFDTGGRGLGHRVLPRRAAAQQRWDFEGQPFELLPWQQFIVGSLFGWKAPDGCRRFRMAFVETAKGSGKSPPAAGIEALHAHRRRGAAPGGSTRAASKQDQARVLFRDAVSMVEQSPKLSEAGLHLSGGLEKDNIAYRRARGVRMGDQLGAPGQGRITGAGGDSAPPLGHAEQLRQLAVQLPRSDKASMVMRSARQNSAMPRPLRKVQDRHCSGAEAPGRCVNGGVALAQVWAVALHGY
ncbi:MAG: terminase large subunit [Halofilum sp. (in: g-proteobacteria)]|nr:terminase large subunit [Halofilum sp. (in: g-proteobacteria)]